MNFAGKRILVTGGTRGIGRAAVEGFLAAGARVAVNGSRAESVAAVLAELKAGERAVAAAGDLSAVEGCRRVVEGAVRALGGLDVLVNNAGVGGPQKRIEEITAEEWDATVNVNLRAVFFCTRYAVPALRAAKGAIVNVASILGLGGRGAGLSLYCASKGGVVNLTRDLAIELAPEVRVNCVCPGAVDTEMLQALGRALGDGDVAAGYAVLTRQRPMPRVARAAEIAEAILWLASDAASFTTGAIQVVDGGVMAKAG
jgi:NAD(P)-dependent dehydrogenase (short-subunit alcohol dehydrogenase family)